MATIKVMQNGPYLVQGDDVTVVDWNGATYAIPKRPFALCRCGGSTTKPFCDGTHSKSGLKSAGSRVPGQQGKPSRQAISLAGGLWESVPLPPRASGAGGRPIQ